MREPPSRYIAIYSEDVKLRAKASKPNEAKHAEELHTRARTHKGGDVGV